MVWLDNKCTTPPGRWKLFVHLEEDSPSGRQVWAFRAVNADAEDIHWRSAAAGGFFSAEAAQAACEITVVTLDVIVNTIASKIATPKDLT